MGTPLNCNEATAYAVCARGGGGPWPFEYDPKYIDVHIKDFTPLSWYPPQVTTAVATPFTVLNNGSSNPRRWSRVLAAPAGIEPQPTYNLTAILDFEFTYTSLLFHWGPYPAWYGVVGDPCSLLIPSAEHYLYPGSDVGGSAHLSICPGGLE